ncbi:MAG: RNA recognition motif domain-containing protein [Roseimicrobium sp.]
MNLYVSNLSYNLTDNELREAFERFGAVTHARIILDRETGRSRGFAFVEMPNDDEARAAINGLNNTDLSGRPLKVVEARPREERPYTPRPGGGGGGGGGGAGGPGGPGGYKGGGGGGGYAGGGGGAGGGYKGGGGGGGGGYRDKGKGGWDRGKRGGGFGEGGDEWH